MFKDKAQLKRDVILIGVFIIIVIGVALTFFFTRAIGETAIVKYENTLLFEIDMQTGAFKANSEVYAVEKEPVISEKYDFLYIDGNPFRELKRGSGIVVYKNNYYILGRLGIVHIEYNISNKMIRVVDETSPYNVCSTQGYSNNAPIVCLPNYVYITFSNSKVDEVLG